MTYISNNNNNNHIQSTSSLINITQPMNCMKCMMSMLQGHIPIVIIIVMEAMTYINNNNSNIIMKTMKWTADSAFNSKCPPLQAYTKSIQAQISPPPAAPIVSPLRHPQHLPLHLLHPQRPRQLRQLRHLQQRPRQPHPWLHPPPHPHQLVVHPLPHPHPCLISGR